MTTLVTKLATLTSVFLLLLVLSPPAAADLEFVRRTCKRTYDFNLCITTLLRDPLGRKAPDTKSLALILFDHVKEKATAAADEVKKLQATRPDLRLPLEECVVDYGMVIHEYHDQAVSGVNGGGLDNARIAMDGSVSEPQSCEDAFQFMVGLNCPASLSRLNYPIQALARVARSVVAQII